MGYQAGERYKMKLMKAEKKLTGWKLAKRLRVRLAWTYAEMSRRIEMDSSNYRRLETAAKPMSAGTAARLAHALVRCGVAVTAADFVAPRIEHRILAPRYLHVTELGHRPKKRRARNGKR